MKTLEWHGCYDEHWSGVISATSFQHPAKFSRGLIARIYQHCLERGYLRKGDLVGDMFGGVGCGGIIAAYAGLNWVGVELEPKFHELAKENFKLHREKLRYMGLPEPVILRGDSRRFDIILSEHFGHVATADAMVSSPPYANISPEKSSSGINIEKQWETYRSQGGGMSLEKFRAQQQRHSQNYGRSSGWVS